MLLNRNRSELRKRRATLAETRVRFVLIEVDVGLTFCKVGRRHKRNGKQKDLERCCLNARKAYQTATRYMLHADATDEQFNSLAAKLELLKLQVEALEKPAEPIETSISGIRGNSAKHSNRT